jgi:pyruvate dehydrogenase E2 component (dihydrolipoamide acetyltransferase)
MAATLEIDTASLAGSGPNGRIIAADIEQAAEEIAAGSRLPLRKSKISLDGPGEDSEGVSFEKAGGAYTDTPLSNIRRIIADKMLRSLNNSAQLTHHSSADARKILQLRKRIKSGQEGQYPEDINLNDMLCFAIIKALQSHPDMNAHFLGEHVRRFKGVHLAIAVDTERGLMVPVLKNAERLSLPDLGQSLKDIAAACKNGSIDPDYLRAEEASFTVSNLGAMGVEIFTPVLNLPQCGIIGINAITKRPVDLGDDTIGFVPYVGISLTYDHRAVDGAPASRFLQTVCENIAQFDPNI